MLSLQTSLSEIEAALGGAEICSRAAVLRLTRPLGTIATD